MSDAPSFATRAAFCSAILARSTGDVVIERFDATSALSGAVYVSCGDEEPDHPLKARNGDAWWTLHPDHLSLEAAGASRDAAADCGQAMNNVLDYLRAMRRARLRLGARDYVFATGARLMQRTGDPALSFAIEGRGPGVSRLLVPRRGMSGEGGALSLSFASDRSEFFASDFSLIATGDRPAESRCGAAILAGFGKTGEAGPRHRTAVLSNVEVGGESGAFGIAFDLEGASEPLVRNCVFAPAAPSGAARESLKSGSTGARLPEAVGT